MKESVYVIHAEANPRKICTVRTVDLPFQKCFSFFISKSMANATYDNLWQQAVDELSEQLHVEGVDEENEVHLVDSTCSCP